MFEIRNERNNLQYDRKIEEFRQQWSYQNEIKPRSVRSRDGNFMTNRFTNGSSTPNLPCFVKQIAIPFRENKTDIESQIQFIVSIYDNNYKFVIRATRQDEPNIQFDIKVDEAESIMKLKSQFNFKYGSIVQCLRMMDDQLVLLNPVSIVKLNNSRINLIYHHQFKSQSGQERVHNRLKKGNKTVL